MRLCHPSAILFSFTLIAATSFADRTPPAPDAALIERAGKIVAPLQLSDAAQRERIRDLIAGQYAALRPLHDLRDNGLKLARDLPDKTQVSREEARIRNDAKGRLADLHYAFLARLAAEGLAPTQIDQIKDGMTYGVAPNTFKVYQQMLPQLTPEQKTQIHAWLLEAREHAMDGGSSEEKHAVFGKYKGRINNYLSQAGYDLKAAEKHLHKSK